MPSIEWSDELSLDLPLMDDTHRECITLLGRMEAAPDADLPALWQVLIEHTVGHFGQEDRWMQATGFASANCHTTQHQSVLHTLREAERVVTEGKYDIGLYRQLVKDLGGWLVAHAQAMDAALALHLRRVGYDPVTGVVHAPDALPAEQIQGCGGACGPEVEAAGRSAESAAQTA